MYNMCGCARARVSRYPSVWMYKPEEWGDAGPACMPKI